MPKQKTGEGTKEGGERTEPDPKILSRLEKGRNFQREKERDVQVRSPTPVQKKKVGVFFRRIDVKTRCQNKGKRGKLKDCQPRKKTNTKKDADLREGITSKKRKQGRGLG